jgi:DNA modification methylase
MGYRILQGDVVEQLKTLADASVDSIVTDPPYGLEFMGKDWDAPWKTDHRQGFDGTMQMPDNPYGRSKVRNGNGASYGADATIMRALQNWYFNWAQEALRVLKPGGYMLSFGGARTYHRMASAIEDAGFEIRDQIMWIYGSGFPKSLDVSKAIDKAAGAKREVVASAPYHRGRSTQQYSETRRVSYDYPPQPITVATTDAAKQWSGWGTALKPSHEPIVVARKPIIGTVAANVMQYGTGALNIDACRVGIDGGCKSTTEYVACHDSINCYKHGLNGQRSPEVDGLGRWPANVIHDGSKEVLAAFPNAPGQLAPEKFDPEERKTQNVYGSMKRGHEPRGLQDYARNGSTNFQMKSNERRYDKGSAARFFYCAKASREERNRGCKSLHKKPLLWSSGTKSPGTFQSESTDRSSQNNHPTVKPIALMTYLCRLVTPPQGTVLDPFMGSGSTAIAALREGFKFIGIEINPEYVEIAKLRIQEDAPLFNKLENAS